MAGTLPNVGEVTPNLNNDGHDGSLAAADTWLQGWLPHIMAGPDYRSGRLAIVITADEDDHNQGNTVLTTVVHPSQHSHVVRSALTHYSLTNVLAQVGHGPCIANGCTAPNFADAFGLMIG
jgi:acid phosphatase